MFGIMTRLVRRKNVLERERRILLRAYSSSTLVTGIKLLTFTGIHLIHGQLLVSLMIAKAAVVVGHCRPEEEVLNLKSSSHAYLLVRRNLEVFLVSVCETVRCTHNVILFSKRTKILL